MYHFKKFKNTERYSNILYHSQFGRDTGIADASRKTTSSTLKHWPSFISGNLNYMTALALCYFTIQ
jgi:hypothetical protein